MLEAFGVRWFAAGGLAHADRRLRGERTEGIVLKEVAGAEGEAQLAELLRHTCARIAHHSVDARVPQ